MLEVVFIGETATYFYFEDYVESLVDAAKEMGLLCSVEVWPSTTSSFAKLRPDTIYVFIQRIPSSILSTCTFEDYSRLAVLNTEQLTRPGWNHAIKQVHDRGIAVLDYSVENVLVSGLSRHYFVPFQDFQEGPSATPKLKVRDACMVWADGFLNRWSVFSSIPNATNVVGFGKARDALLFEHKVLVNVHATDDYRVHEHMRTDRCVYQQMIVVTEPSIDTDKLPLRPYMVVEERSKIPARVQSILENYKAVHQQLFGNMDRTTLQQQAREEWRKVYHELQSRGTTK
jgi:hypothetical protein